MKPRSLLLLSCLLAGAVLAAPTAPTPAESALIRQHIDALLKLRRKPERLPVDPPNPFAQLAGGAGIAAGDRETPATTAPDLATLVATEETHVATPAELLARFASRLKITGIIRLKDQVNIIINDSPWKEGDFIIVDRGARLIQLQVVRIQPGQLTLRLEDAELILKF